MDLRLRLVSWGIWGLGFQGVGFMVQDLGVVTTGFNMCSFDVNPVSERQKEVAPSTDGKQLNLNQQDPQTRKNENL